MKKAVVFFLFFSVCGDLCAEPVSPKDATRAASFFLDAERHREQMGAGGGEGGTLGERPLASVSLSETKPIAGPDGVTIAYVVELAPEGFVILSADTDTRPILGYSFSGKFPYQDSRENALLHLVQWDVEAQLNGLKALPEETKSKVQENKSLWEKYLSDDQDLLADFVTAQEWGPLMKFQTWDQGDTIFWQDNYNQYCPENPVKPGERCVVGCTATSAAQMLYYWHYPARIEFGIITDQYTSWQWYKLTKGEWWPIGIPADHSVWDFPSFGTLNEQLEQISYDDSMQEKAYLSFAMGIKHKMNYGQESGAAIKASVYSRKLGYGSARQVSKAKGCWDDDTRAGVVQNIKEGWPAHVGIRGDDGGHSVIVHGYRSTGEFYLNLGWGGTGDCWYSLPAIDTTTCQADPGLYSFDVIDTVVYNIAPYKGWPQDGGDPCNRFRTVYGVPATAPHVKYERGTNGSLEGFIIGEGNKIFATHDPDSYENYARLTMVDQYGTTSSDHELTQITSSITTPIQAANGDVFFGAGDGVYRFRPESGSLTRVYQDLGNDHYGNSTPRVDEDGYMYFGSWTTLVSIDQSDDDIITERWRWAVPSGGDMKVPIPSIDAERDNVYVAYWMDSTDEAVLVCLNRSSGQTRYVKAFPSTPSQDRGIHTPAVGSDGTVYASVRTKIYALTPGTSSFYEKWVQDKHYAKQQPIALGWDDSIYTEYWTLEGDNYYLTLAKLNPSDGSVAWEKPMPDVGTYSDFRQPICAANGVVVFPVYWDFSPSPKIQLYAYSTSGDFLWDYTPSRMRGELNLAVASGVTLCIAQKDGNIIALSDGTLGDPDDGGMGWTNNNPPLTPSEPVPADRAENLDRSVTLEWQCSDQDPLENNPGWQLKYDVFLGELNPADTASARLLPVANSLTTNSFVVQGLNAGRGYTWQVIATDGQAVSDSPIWTFSTMPFEVTAFNPGAANTITISWRGATNNVTIEHSETLSPGNWQYVAGPLSGSSWTGAVPSGPIGFFRLKAE